MPGSHEHHEDAMRRLCTETRENTWEHVRLPRGDPLFDAAGGASRPPVQPTLAVGDLLLWDSRTAHLGVETVPHHWQGSRSLFHFFQS